MELLTEEQLQYIKRKYNIENGLESAVLRWSSANGHLEIVKLLLQDQWVIKKGNLEIVKNRNARIIQRWYTRILYNPNSNYIRNIISKF